MSIHRQSYTRRNIGNWYWKW